MLRIISYLKRCVCEGFYLEVYNQFATGGILSYFYDARLMWKRNIYWNYGFQVILLVKIFHESVLTVENAR